jgi:hypothetical protein
MIARNTADSTAPIQGQPIAADWLGSLSALIRELSSSEFKTVDALLSAVACDDVAGGNMLKRILYWQSALQREFYLSNTDWRQQCRVTRSVIDRVKATIFPTCGVIFTVRFNKRANANVTHYSLNQWAFLRRLSAVTGMPTLFLAERCVGIQQNVVLQNDRTLTIDSPIKTATDIVNVSDVPKKKILSFKSELPQSTPEQMTVIALLKKAGVWGNRAVAYAMLPEDIVRQCIADAQSADDSGRISQSKRIGYLMGALRNQKQAHADKPVAVQSDYMPVFKTELPASPSNPVAALVDEPGGEVDVRTWQLPQKPIEVTPEVVNPQLDVVINDRGGLLNTPRHVWLAAFSQLQLQLDSGTWQTYVSRAQLADYADGVWTIQAHNERSRDVLQYRMNRTIWRLLSDFSGQEVELKFTVAE